MNKRGLSRMLSVLLLVVMVVSMLPVSAYAEGTTASLVTDISSLAAGDKVVIAAKDYDYALGTTQNKNNREAVAVTKAGSSITVTETVQVLTLEAGTKEGTFAFNTGSGYLYAASSSSNHLKTQSALSDNSSWTVEISADGAATVKAQGANTRNWMRFNSSNNPVLFSCYASGQADICIYKVGAGVVDPDPEPIETVATPTASPAAGEVEKGTQVSFACATEGATIYYKTTGDYQAYTAPVTVDADTTFTVKATKDGMNDSAEATFAYTIKSEEAGDPWKDVPAKYSVYKKVDDISSGDVVVIYNAKNEKAVTATVKSSYYLEGESGLTVGDGFLYGDAENIEWTVGASGTDFTFTQGEAVLAGVQSVSGTKTYNNISLTDAANAAWTLETCNAEDGSYYIYNPAMNSKYPDEGGHIYLKWYEDKTRFSLYDTSKASEGYFDFTFYELVREGKVTSVAAPEASPTAGEVAKGTEVVLSCATEGASILYKTAADAEFAEYTAPIVIDEDTTIIAKAVKEGLADSEEVSFAYTVKINTKTADYTETIADGDKVVIYYPAGAKVLSDEVYVYTNTSGNSKDELKSLDGTVDGTTLTYSEGTAELNVVVDENGNYSFVTDEGKYLYLDGTNVNFTDVAGDYTLFELETAATIGYYIKSAKAQVKDQAQYMEYFKPYFTCYKMGTKTDYYTFQFFKIPEVEDHIVTDLSELTDGAKVVIFNPANMKALSQTYSGYYNTGVDVTASDGKLSGYGSTEVWTVGVNSDGSFTFSTADGKKFSMGAEFTSTPLDGINPNWKVLPADTADCFYIQNAVRGNYLEWYKGQNRWSAANFKGEDDLFAQQFYLVVKEEDQPADTDSLPKAGDQVVIYNASAEGVIGLQDELGVSMSCVPATIEDGKAVVGNGGRVFTVSVSGEDYSFESGGKYLASNDTEELFLTETLNDYAKWNLEKKTDGYVMYNKAAAYTFSGGGSAKVCIEYFSGSFSGWTYKSADSAIFEMNFYPVAEGTPVAQGIVNKPAIVFGALPEAYVGQDYTFTFTVDAVFGVDGTPCAQVMLNTPQEIMVNQDGETFRITVPARFLEGLESLTVHVTALDTLGTPIEGDAVFTVLDEPVFSDLTPNPGSQTGEDKRPVISAKVANAGEEPTITMTLNGEDVIPSYNEGLISYMAESEMEEGRTTVSITVKRADGKEATKSWSFTVGTARYQLYFGQLHSHTTYSDGSGSLDTALDYVKNLPESANVDFVAFTDHSNYFDSTSAANPEGALYDMSLASETSQTLWNTYKSTVAAFNASQSDIVAIAGFEMTWSGGPGHINTFNTPGIVSRNNSTLNNKTSDAGLQAYYALLSQPEGADSLSQLNHPGSTFGTFSDFNYWNPVIDSRVFLVEVGNGEGQVGAGGYYPSYEYYTMALDKGWHVAPSNNQDNHKGKWGNANDARDVILTDDFSEQGIYNAIRAMHMYSTEDKNLEITYTLNDQQLGSSIAVPEKVNISVTVNDPDASDSISKVEVIVNSGKTVHTWNDPAELATGALSVELDPDYSYYYIRVTEGDGDLAVTAPVWVGESLKLGISSLACGTATPVTGEELKLTTTFFNSEAADATVKSITYTTNGSVVLGADTTGYTVPASGTLDVEFKYTPEIAKVTTITVTAVVEQNGKEYTFTKDIELDILDADSLVYIGIDASHHNEYVAGNYKDSMGNFGALAASYSARTVQLNTSDDLIAACSNPKFQMLILTAPSRRDGDVLREPYDTYSEEEIAAITEFNSKGGTVVLCGWGDFYESYASFPAEDHMAAQQNKILTALGSTLRISDDETKDNSYNGGQAQRLYLSSYNFESFLLNGVEYDAENPHNNLYTELYSQYGGASIYTVGGTIPATVTPVVFGFDTTYSSDDDGDSYGGLGSIPTYSFDGADRLMVMATEELPGKGLIVVSGAAFLSNFEVQATISDNGSEKNYSNYKICQNLLNYINPVAVTDIATVRAQKEAGFKYTIEGVVTSNASGYDKDTAFFDCIYVQDETGGICCFPVAGEYKIGDKVRITGTTDFFQGEPELQVSAIEVIGSGDIAPTEVTAAEINNRSAEGKLITLKGVVVSFEEANGLVQTIMVKDAAGDVARVFIDGYITTAKEVENLALGAAVTVTGLASYDDTFNAPEGPFPRIRIRNRADVVCGEVVEHVHDYTWTTTTPATCTEPGLETGECVCGDTTTRPIPATGHNYKWTVKEATCTEAGLKTGVCENCGDTITEVIPATGHTFSEWTVTTPATCTKDGVESRGCACGYIETRTIKATGHQFGEWKTVREPTDYLAGKEERVCSVCGEKETRKIPSLKGVESGDDNNILFWIVALTVSGAGAAVLLTKTRKKYKGSH